jgi:hypothetical protein
MEKIQDFENSKKNSKKSSNFLLFIHSINILLLILNFIINILGNPILKYVYFAQVIFIVLTVIIFDFEEVLFEIMILFFIEGQGRILWDYQSWARVIFDLITFLSIAKIFIFKKKIYEKNNLPWPVILLITLHFSWYIIQLFNIYSASIFGAVAASKIYIFPILFFLAIMLSNTNANSKEFKQVLNLFIFILILEIILNYYQIILKQSHLLGISRYYYKAMSNGIFTDILFRPFATTPHPGGLSIFLFLTVGFLYLKKFSFKASIFKLVLMLGSCFSIITCQVRSAMVKYLMIVGLIQLGKMLYERFILATILPVFIILIGLIVGGNIFFSNTESSGDQNLDYAKTRISSLGDVNKIKSDRLNPGNFGRIASNRIMEYPLGLGPGMTGAAASLNKEELAFNPLINKNLLWTFDNLFISLIIDLGIGSIFYILLIFSIPIYFLRYLLVFYSKKSEDNYRILLICASTLVVILIGNWGAIGLTYNPESFIFWFFSALGFKTIGNYKNAKDITA